MYWSHIFSKVAGLQQKLVSAIVFYPIFSRCFFDKGDFKLDGWNESEMSRLFLLLHMRESFVYWRIPEMLIPLKSRNHFNFSGLEETSLSF